MSLREQQNILARLYADPQFRDAFFSQPETIGREGGLDESEIADILAAAGDELRFFSESLVWKRFREVEKMLSITRPLMGDEFQAAFFDFAPIFNPQGVRKHYEDAVEFCRFIEAGDRFLEPVKDAARYDRTRLVFFNDGRRIALCRRRADVEHDSAGRVKSRRQWLGFAVWFRLGRRVFHFKV